MAKPITVTDESFEIEVVQSTTPVLVDFWAQWCQPCKMIAPILDQVADEADGVLTIAKINVDDSPDAARKFGVSSIPALLLFKDGEPIDRILGFRPKKQLLALLGKHVEGLAPAK